MIIIIFSIISTVIIIIHIIIMIMSQHRGNLSVIFNKDSCELVGHVAAAVCLQGQ